MPDFPLTLQHFLWRSTTLFPTKEIVTGGRPAATATPMPTSAARGAAGHALKELGVGPGDRVGTLAWNNYRHSSCTSRACAGAVLHTLSAGTARRRRITLSSRR